MAEDRVRDEGTEDEDAARAAAVQALWEALHGGSDDAAADEPDDDADAADAGFRVASARDARVMMGSGHLAQVYSEDRSHKDLVAQWVWDHRKEIAGDAADWHNLYAAYNEKGLVRSAMQMALAGLERFPRDASLHADVIWSAADLGDWETGDEHLALVEQADNRAGEDWTLAVYVADYLRAKARTQGAEDRKATYQHALEFVRAAERRIPAIDRMVNSEAEILIDAGDIDGACEVLEDAIFMSDYDGSARNPRRRPVAQCCITYLQTILADSCDYETITRVCDAGVRFAAIPSESTNMGYFMYRKAEAMDGQMLADAAGRGAKGFSPDRVREVLRTYSLAYKLCESTTYRSICRKRFMILSSMADVQDMDVDVWCPKDKDD